MLTAVDPHPPFLWCSLGHALQHCGSQSTTMASSAASLPWDSCSARCQIPPHKRGQEARHWSVLKESKSFVEYVGLRFLYGENVSRYCWGCGWDRGGKQTLRIGYNATQHSCARLRGDNLYLFSRIRAHTTHRTAHTTHHTRINIHTHTHINARTVYTIIQNSNNMISSKNIKKKNLGGELELLLLCVCTWWRGMYASISVCIYFLVHFILFLLLFSLWCEC